MSGYVSLNTGPIQRSPDTSSTIWEPLNKKGLHFLHININSLLSKKDEIRCISNNTKATIFGITESKLDHTVPDSEVNFNTRTLHCKEIEILVFDILLPKSKPITIGVFYRPPNQG